MLVFGDIHEKQVWNPILSSTDGYDKVVFEGDYVDSFEKNPNAVQNLQSIISLKKEFGDKVVLLWGNHDMQYLYVDDARYRCSGFQQDKAFAFHQIFKENKQLFQYAYQEKNYLFTHAGVTKKFLDYLIKHNKDVLECSINIADFLNLVGTTKNEIMFNMCGVERNGKDICSGLLWTGKEELKKDTLHYFNQVVGHTWNNEIEVYGGLHRNVIYFVDALHSENDNKIDVNYLIINI